MKIKINADNSKVTVSGLNDLDWKIIKLQLKKSFDYQCELLDLSSIGIAELQILYKDKFSSEFEKTESFKMTLPQAMAFVHIMPFCFSNQYQVDMISDLRYNLCEKLGQFLKMPLTTNMPLLQSPKLHIEE